MNTKQIAKDILAPSEELKRHRHQFQPGNKKLCDYIVLQLKELSKQVENLDRDPDDKDDDGTLKFAKAVPVGKPPGSTL